MSLEKAIKYGKEHRKPYYDSRDFDYSCRSHGSCPYCQSKRKYKIKRRITLGEEYGNDRLWGYIKKEW